MATHGEESTATRNKFDLETIGFKLTREVVLSAVGIFGFGSQILSSGKSITL